MPSSAIEVPCERSHFRRGRLVAKLAYHLVAFLCGSVFRREKLFFWRRMHIVSSVTSVWYGLVAVLYTQRYSLFAQSAVPYVSIPSWQRPRSRGTLFEYWPSPYAQRGDPRALCIMLCLLHTIR